VAAGQPFARRLDADEADGLVGVERVEEADGVGAAAHAGDGVIREPALRVQHLLPRLGADHRLEIADDHRVGVRPDDGAEQVVGRLDVRHPVADRLVDRVLEGA